MEKKKEERDLLSLFEEGKYDELIRVIEDNIRIIKETNKSNNIGLVDDVLTKGSIETVPIEIEFEKDLEKKSLLKLGTLIGELNYLYHNSYKRLLEDIDEEQIQETSYENELERYEQYNNMPHISIGKFLSKYFNIQGKNLNSLTHKQLEEICGISPCIDAHVVTNEDIEEIKTGKILLVRDSETFVLGYKNPLLTKDEESIEELFDHPIIAEFYKNLERATGLRKNEIEELKVYELEDVLKECKRQSDEKTKKIIVRELQRRKLYENDTREDKLEKVRKRELKEEMI